MRKGLMRSIIAVGIGLIACMTAEAAGPSVAQVLALKPVQPGTVYDTPSQDTWEKCKLEVLKQPTSGWLLRDGRGLVVRKFTDSNNDNVVDRWSYYMNGQEVYRDIDTNANGKADQHRWYHTGGSRWAIDSNEDGRIDGWKAISAEEATAEAIAALASGNFDRLRCVLLTEDDVRTLGLGKEATGRVQKALAETSAQFRSVSPQLSDAEFSRFDGHNPMAVPASEVGSSRDFLIYQNATIIAEARGQTRWLRVAEVVRIGETWKLSEVPELIDPNKPVEISGVVVPTFESSSASDGSRIENSNIEDNEEVQKYVAALQKHDQTLPSDAGDTRQLIAYHVKRAELCAYIGSKSRKLANREHWYQQTADSLNAAIQTGGYSSGIRTLEQYSEQFAKTSWGKQLAGYFKYRAINSGYALQLAQPKVDHAKAQEAFLGELEKFLKDFPDAGDTPEALLQLGNGLEFANKDDEALKHYKRIVTQFPKSAAFRKAAGAVRRLEAMGQPFQLVGNSLSSSGSIDTTRYRGKVLVVNYWATWCEPCKAEMPRLQKLREKYASRGLEVVGACLDADPAAAKAYVQRNGYSWPQIYEKGSMESELAVRYGIISLPYLILIDAEGRVINRDLQFTQLDQEVEKALTQKVASRDR